MRVDMPQSEIEKERCGVCSKQAKLFCPYCVDEYEFGPNLPTTFYCNEHYLSVVETGNCCYGAERVYGTYLNS